jgi:SAM-dependent methyltransferase
MFQTYWNDIAAFYDVLYHDLWHDKRVAEMLLRLATAFGYRLSPDRNLSIVDVACGTGHPAYALCKMGFKVTCADGSPEMLTRLQSNFVSAGQQFPPMVCSTWHDLPTSFAAEHFDILLCVGNSICHLPPTAGGVETAVRNFLRLLKPGGLCFLDAKKYNRQFEELNFNKDRTNLEARWYRTVDVNVGAGALPPSSFRFHLLSEYNLDNEHRSQIRVVRENRENGELEEIGIYDFWPVDAAYLAECFAREGCSRVRVFDMRLTQHKYDFVVTAL